MSNERLIRSISSIGMDHRAFGEHSEKSFELEKILAEKLGIALVDLTIFWPRKDTIILQDGEYRAKQGEIEILIHRPTNRSFVVLERDLDHPALPGMLLTLL